MFAMGDNSIEKQQVNGVVVDQVKFMSAFRKGTKIRIEMKVMKNWK